MRPSLQAKVRIDRLTVKRLLFVMVLAALMASGCTRFAAPPTEAVVQTVSVCDSIPVISAPEDAFRATPIYVANEMPTDEIQAWAGTKPGFEELWIDRDHSGWVIVAFSSDAATRQADLAREFPGVGVVAIGVDWKKADLEKLQQRAMDELSSRFDISSSIDVRRGMVDIGIGVLSDERIDVVRSSFAGERVCVSGIAPNVAVPEAPQPSSGDGWRLLAMEDVGQPYRTGIAADDGAYRTLWDEIGLHGEPPAVDFGSEVVVWFGAVYGSSCPLIRLDGVVSELDRRILHGTIVLPSTYSACTADANPKAFLVAVRRSILPIAPFAIQLGAEDPPPGAPEERTIVDVDLRELGSVLGPGEAHPDPSLPEPWVVEPGAIIEPGFEAPFRFDVRCGAEWLGPLNDTTWRTEVASGAGRFLPPEWEGLVDGDKIVVTVLLQTDPVSTITATAGDRAVVYRPTAEPQPDCP
jgi:hypothetical protein